MLPLNRNLDIVTSLMWKKLPLNRKIELYGKSFL